MKFSMNEWRKMYDRVHELGALLKESRPTYDGRGNYIAAEKPASKYEQEKWEKEMDRLISASKNYLDQCGLKMPKPLWYFDRKDKKTWASHESFKYQDLMLIG